MPDLIKNPKPHMVRSNYVDMSNPAAKKKEAPAPADDLDATIEESMQPAKKSAAAGSSKEGSKSSGAKAGGSGSTVKAGGSAAAGASGSGSKDVPTTVVSATAEGNAEQPGKAEDDSDWLTPIIRTAGVAAGAAAVYAYLREAGLPEKAAQKMAQTAAQNPSGASDLIVAATGDDPRIAQADVLSLAAPEPTEERLALPAPSGASTMPDEEGVYSPGRTGTGGPSADEAGVFSPGRTPQDPRFQMADDAMSEVGAEFAPEPQSARVYTQTPTGMRRFMKTGERVNQFTDMIPGSTADWLDEAIAVGDAVKPRVRVKAPSVRVPAP